MPPALSEWEKSKYLRLVALASGCSEEKLARGRRISHGVTDVQEAVPVVFIDFFQNFN